jgi:hypothetical protein
MKEKPLEAVLPNIILKQPITLREISAASASFPGALNTLDDTPLVRSLRPTQ